MPRVNILRLSALLLTFFLTAAASWAQEMTALQHYSLGREAFSREDYLSAVERFRSALTLNPSYLEALEGLAEAFFYLGEYDEAFAQVTQASRLGKFKPSVNVLWGRILLGQGQLEEGLAKFEEVLAREPQHQGALFGLAEYQVMKNRYVQAAAQLEAILKNDPANLRALLSLMLIDAQIDDTRGWSEARARALDLHSSEEKVHLFSAEHFYREGQKDKARESVDNYLRLTRSDRTKGLLLKTMLLLDEGKASEALQVIDGEVFKIPANQKNAEAFYLRGLAGSRLGQGMVAQQAFSQAVRLDKDNEVYRIAWENLYAGDPTLDAQTREALSRHHFQRAADLASKSRLSPALDEYRRGLIIFPEAAEARFQRGQIFQTLGYSTSFLEEMEFIAEKVPSFRDRDFLDEWEIRRSLYEDSLPARWGLSLAALGQLEDTATQPYYRPFGLGIYYVASDSSLEEYGAIDDLGLYLYHEFTNHRGLDPGDARRKKLFAVASGNEAFRRARDAGQDFYLLVQFRGGLRDFSATASLFLGRTGKLVRTFSIFKKGLERITGGLRELAAAVAGYFPLRGSLVQRKGTAALINLGARDGVEPEMKFTVVREKALSLSGDDVFFHYTPADVLGTFTVSETDDKVSGGILEKNGFFDTMAVRDDVLFVKDPPKVPPTVGLPLSADLQRQILNLR